MIKSVYLEVTAILLVFCVAMNQARPRADINSEIYRTDDIGRLRRGFQTSALATARGFGKRGAPGNIPFINNPAALANLKHPKMDNSPLRRDTDRSQASYIIEMMRSNPSLASDLVDKFVEEDDGYIQTNEMLRFP